MPEPIDKTARHARVQAANARAVEGDDRRISLAVSSEEPVERDYGNEVLSHDHSAIDLDFFGSGRAPLLVDHDTRDVVGVVESAVRGGDKVLRAIVRFGKSARASEVLADVRDGIRANTSVGYNISEYKPLPNDAGYRITKWTPVEVSIVSIPADESVGVGRSAITETPAKRQKMDDLIEDEGIQAVVAALEMSDRHNVRSAMETWLTPERRRLPAKDIRAGARNVLLDNLGDGKPMVDNRLGAPALHLGGERSLSFADVLRVQMGIGDPGHAREHSQEMARQAKRTPQGMFVSPDVLATRATTLSTDVAGAFHTDHRAGSFIDSLKPMAAVMKLGATIIQGSADISIPKMTAGTSSQWVGEDSAPSDSAPAVGSVTLSYHQLSSTVNLSRKTVVQSFPAADDIVRRDMLRELGVTVDLAAITGSGTPPVPRGLLSTSGLGAVVFGAAGDTLSWEKVLEFIETVESANIVGNSYGFLSNFHIKRALMATERASGTAKFILDDANPDKLAGYPIAFSGNVPANLTKSTGSNLSAMIFGNWSDLLIGQLGALDVILDPYTESAKGNLRISVHSAWDIGVRYGASFAVAKDIVTTP